VTRAYVFRAELGTAQDVSRTVVLGEEQTLEDLNELLRAEFGWHDPHLYSFWLDGRFWGNRETEYSAPFELEESGAKSAQTPLGRLGLEPEQRIAYLFDYGDNWEVDLTVAEVRAAGSEPLPAVLERRGEAPPQYKPLDEYEE
jgi:hypothetical protein